MKVLITGGAGFIGSHIADLLIEEGHNVCIVDNLTTGDKCNINPKAGFYELDIMDRELDSVVMKEVPEVILHLAALVYVQQSIENPLADAMANVIGTLNVLKSACKHNVRKIIYASTCAVYGNMGLETVKEEHQVSPISFYGASKYMAEMYIRLFSEIFKLDYTILRFSNVYGPRQKHHGEGGVIPIFIDNINDKVSSNIFGDGGQTRDFVYVSDVARAGFLALSKGSLQTINIGTGIGTTIIDLYMLLNGSLNSNIPASYRPERVGDARHIALNPSKADALLGWKANITLQEGLEKTIKAYDFKSMPDSCQGGS